MPSKIGMKLFIHLMHASKKMAIGNAYVYQRTWSTLAQIMVWHLLGEKVIALKII